MKAALFLPEPGSHAAQVIDPGSGIVGVSAALWGERDREDDRIVIDFEGNRHGAANIVTYADRCYHAWGRQSEHYPTTARLVARADELVQVGWLTDTDAVLVNPAKYGRLTRWLGFRDVIPHAELASSRPTFVRL